MDGIAILTACGPLTICNNFHMTIQYNVEWILMQLIYIYDSRTLYTFLRWTKKKTQRYLNSNGLMIIITFNHPRNGFRYQLALPTPQARLVPHLGISPIWFTTYDRRQRWWYSLCNMSVCCVLAVRMLIGCAKIVFSIWEFDRSKAPRERWLHCICMYIWIVDTVDSHHDSDQLNKWCAQRVGALMFSIQRLYAVIIFPVTF